MGPSPEMEGMPPLFIRRLFVGQCFSVLSHAHLRREQGDCRQGGAAETQIPGTLVASEQYQKLQQRPKKGVVCVQENGRVSRKSGGTPCS
jgi:hypothetical protein